jgi:hypothetical protein
MTGAPDNWGVVGFVDLSFSLSNSNFALDVEVYDVLQTSIQIYVGVISSSYFLAPLRISYLTSDPSYPYLIIFSSFTFYIISGGTYTSLPVSSTPIYASNQFDYSSFNLSHTYGCLTFINSFNFINASNGCFDM